MNAVNVKPIAPRIKAKILNKPEYIQTIFGRGRNFWGS